MDASRAHFVYESDTNIELKKSKESNAGLVES